MAPRVLIDNHASAAYTVIEVNGRDRPGLLYRLTRALADLNLQIASAKISTYGEKVVDVFYVKDLFGLKIEDERRLKAIRESLLAALAEPLAAAPATNAPARSPSPVRARWSPCESAGPACLAVSADAAGGAQEPMAILDRRNGGPRRLRGRINAALLPPRTSRRPASPWRVSRRRMSRSPLEHRG